MKTLNYWIKRNLKYTYKKASVVSPDISKVDFVAHQAAVAEVMQNALLLELYIIYIDESAFTRNEGKAYGFGSKGKRVEFRLHKPTYSIGCIAAISRHRLEGLQLRDGKTNKHAFMHFILQMVQELRREGVVDLKKVVFYLDNATYHTTEDTIKLFQLLDIRYIFAPAYLSPLNPIEYLFGVLKKRLRHHYLVNK